MTDNLKAEDRHRTMRAVKGKGTRLEKRICLMLVRMGIKGWRKNASDIVGKPDIVFDHERIAIFIDGCFWHGCPYCQRKLPESNKQYWERKIKRNVELATIHNQSLTIDGWVVLRIWEHEVRDAEGRQKIKADILNVLTTKKRNL